MTYNVFGGTLNPTQIQLQLGTRDEQECLFQSHSRWLFPFPPAPIPVLLVVSHQITNYRWT